MRPLRTASRCAPPMQAKKAVSCSHHCRLCQCTQAHHHSSPSTTPLRAGRPREGGLEHGRRALRAAVPPRLPHHLPRRHRARRQEPAQRGKPAVRAECPDLFTALRRLFEGRLLCAVGSEFVLSLLPVLRCVVLKACVSVCRMIVKRHHAGPVWSCTHGPCEIHCRAAPAALHCRALHSAPKSTQQPVTYRCPHACCQCNALHCSVSASTAAQTALQARSRWSTLQAA